MPKHKWMLCLVRPYNGPLNLIDQEMVYTRHLPADFSIWISGYKAFRIAASVNVKQRITFTFVICPTSGFFTAIIVKQLYDIMLRQWDCKWHVSVLQPNVSYTIFGVIAGKRLCMSVFVDYIQSVSWLFLILFGWYSVSHVHFSLLDLTIIFNSFNTWSLMTLSHAFLTNHDLFVWVHHSPCIWSSFLSGCHLHMY